MEFTHTGKVKERLEQMEKLTSAELQEIASHVQFLSDGKDSPLVHRYFAEIVLRLAGDLISLKTALDQNREAIRSFDESSRKHTRWLIGLTVVLVILTIVIAGFTILLWRRG